MHVAPSGGHASSATWWPKLEPMQVALQLGTNAGGKLLPREILKPLAIFFHSYLPLQLQCKYEYWHRYKYQFQLFNCPSSSAYPTFLIYLPTCPTTWPTYLIYLPALSTYLTIQPGLPTSPSYRHLLQYRLYIGQFRYSCDVWGRPPLIILHSNSKKNKNKV